VNLYQVINSNKIEVSQQAVSMSPPPIRGIEHVKSLSILGVVVNDRMTAADHVSHLYTHGVL